MENRMTTTTHARARVISAPKAIRFVTVEPGRISLHGVVLTDSEYAMLRAIAERMKRADTIAEVAREATC
jgi:protein gp37